MRRNYKEIHKRLDEREQEIERLNNIIKQLENQLKLICEMYYDDKDTAAMEQWIEELKGAENGIMGEKKTD